MEQDIALDPIEVSLFDTIKVIISAQNVTDLLVFEQFLSLWVTSQVSSSHVSMAYAKIHTVFI